MTLHKEFLRLNEDGSPHFHYFEDDPNKALVITGPIYGNVTLPNGSVVDVTPDIISVDAGQEIHVSNAIGERHATEGHPAFVSDPNLDNYGFVHIPTPVEEVTE